MTLPLKREYFNGLAERWDGLPCPPDAPAKVARFVGRAAPPAGDVLDVGCGTGLLLEPLASASRRIVELDVAERMLAENRRKAAGRGPVSHVCADALRLPFRQGTFHAVLCFNALPHFEPMQEVLRILLDCLRPGGSLAVGHLMGSRNLNAFHASLVGPVGQDCLPAAAALGHLLAGLGAQVQACEEAPDWYYVQARK